MDLIYDRRVVEHGKVLRNESAARPATLLDDGWTLVPRLFSAETAEEIADACAALSTDPEPRDKPAGGTRRFVDVGQRVPAVADLLAHRQLSELVDHAIPGARPTEVTYRCPAPGHGEQRLHADEAAGAPTGPWEGVVAILTLCEFDAENGATGLVPGSHRRPDLQRNAGQLDSHPEEIVISAPVGSAILFATHVIHRGRQNNSASPRPAIQAVWRRTAMF